MQTYKDYETYKREQAMRAQLKKDEVQQPDFETDEDDIPSEGETQDLDRVMMLNELNFDDSALHSKSGKPNNIDTSLEKSPLFENQRKYMGLS